jgi:hypothetical protein
LAAIRSLGWRARWDFRTSVVRAPIRTLSYWPVLVVVTRGFPLDVSAECLTVMVGFPRSGAGHFFLLVHRGTFLPLV